MAPGKARVGVPLSELGQEILNWFGKVCFDKAYLSFKKKCVLP